MKELPFLAGEQGRASFLLFLFFISAVVLIGWGIWEGTLPPGEGAIFAEQAREAAAGDPWPPRFDGETAVGPPPLPLWAAAASIGLFGASAWTVRLPFVLFALAAVALVRAAGEAAAGKGGAAQGLLAAILLVTCPFFGRYAPHPVPGVVLACAAAVALLGLVRLPRADGAWTWGAGVAAAAYAAGAPGLLLAPAGLIALAADRGRRGAFRRPVFLAATAGGIAAGLAWTLGAGNGAPPLALATAGETIRGAWGAWTASLPWSVLALLAAARIVLPGAAKRVEGVDRLLFVFAALLTLAAGLAGGGGAQRFLVVAPAAAVMAAREAARLLAARGGETPADERVWSLDRVLVMILCLLMMLIVLTPLDLHRRENDRIDDIAGMTARLLPPGERLANFRQPGRTTAARLLFYGGRSIDRRAVETPDELALAIERGGDRFWLTTMRDMADLRRREGFPVPLDMVYRAGDWVIFAPDRGAER